MLHLGSIYLTTSQFQNVVQFYSSLLNIKPTAMNKDRWAQFDFEGHCIAIYNEEFDKKMIATGEDISSHYNEEYLMYLKEHQTTYGNQAVLNFWTEDLNTELDRVKKLGIGEVSAIKYVNIAMPYWFFTITDPDGTIIEITGNYKVLSS